MDIINFILKYKWCFIMILFITALILGISLFTPLKKEKVPPTIKTKVNFEMKKENIRKVVLDNGLTVLAFKDSSCPKVLLQIAYGIGSAVEQAGQRGLAHLIEHMIFKGTDKLSEGDIDAISRKYGATFNAFTAKDMTSYYFEVDKNNWRPFLAILADCMQNAKFDEQHLASELKTVIQELKMYKDKYWMLMLEKASELIYPSNHPYHFPIIGYKQDLLNLFAQQLKDFYKKYYGPQNATLFIVGDIDLDKAIEMAKLDFGDIKSGNISIEKIEQERIQPELFVQHNTYIYENVQKEQLGFYWLVPGIKDLDENLLNCVEFILGQGQSSRLYRRLVDEEKVAIDLAVFTDLLKDAGTFLILIEPVDGKREQCKKIVEQELIKLIQHGVTDQELQKIINTKSREFFEKLQSLSYFTYEWIKSYLFKKNEYEIFEKINKFSEIKSEQIQNFISQYLDPFLINQITLLPLPENKKSHWEKLKKESDELDIQILAKHKRTTNIEEPKFLNKLNSPAKLDFEFPKPDKKIVLDNGLTVILKNNTEWPILNLICRFKDAEFYSQSKDGIVLNLMMNLLIEECTGFTKKENVDFFENLGASVSFDVSGGVLDCLNNNIELILERFFLVLTKPDFKKDSLEKLKNIFIDLYQRAKDSPNSVAKKLLENLIYKGQSNDWFFDQAINLIKNVDIKTIYDFHKKYVTPRNMIVSISGNFDINLLEASLIDVTKNWSGEKVEIDYKVKSNFEPGNQVNYFMLRDQVVLLLGQPSSIDIYNPDLIPIKLLNMICFDSLGSRIFQLREQTGLFYTAVGSYAANATKNKGFDFVGAILSLDRLSEAKKVLIQVINNFANGGVTKEELDAARQMYLKNLIDLTASNEHVASMFARLQAFDLGFDYYDKALKRVQTIDLKELNEICKKYFVTDNLSTVCVGRVGKEKQ
ncbi:insulinase family protein [Candidatus Babeliales bacterium]|nr:insulinase family protein [Candidatus Babeliales bacterium]MCF7899620.1 insulinase family protein [Candidatus Babeliales bacterium]